MPGRRLFIGFDGTHDIVTRISIRPWWESGTVGLSFPLPCLSLSLASPGVYILLLLALYLSLTPSFPTFPSHRRDLIYLGTPAG